MIYFAGIRNGGYVNGTLVAAQLEADARVECWRACLKVWMPFIPAQAIDDVTSDEDKLALRDALIAVGFSIIEVSEPTPA